MSTNLACFKCLWYSYRMRWLLILLFLTGCSGYRYTQQDNPLSQYGIESLSVPMFYNYSNQPEVGPNFTREVYRLLSSYPGLKLRSGYHANMDAVMIGIIKSPEKVFDTLTPSSPRVAKDRAGNAVGSKRQNFYVPGVTDIIMLLQVIVIKKPTEEELSLLKSGLGDKVQLNSRIIFNETLPIRTQYIREIFDNTIDPVTGAQVDNGVPVTATQNSGIQRKMIRSLAEQAALSVRDVILYAF